ncbi:unnamed protein product [Adineta ricciae]|uniref:Alpha/beta hydrolase fold-3 domain-containing protein n=1 Tax=Adineta ricciae TaxID=249248 RepID=A0A813S4G2_ADIRI|nr:unnamed protein product [Adineta ricciae]CAF1032725.1 unnamed protein product [Adineta ricciae]
MVSIKQSGIVVRNLSIFILILSVLIPLRYGSIDPEYLRIRCVHSLLSLTYTVIRDENRPTLSADYRAFETMLRLRSVYELDPSADTTNVVKELRSLFTLATIIPKPKSCQIQKQIYNHQGHTVEAYWVNHRGTNEQPRTQNILMYLHGGAYLAGDIHSYSGYGCYLSHLFDMSLIYVEYRLAPEHPLPHAVDDVVALYHALLTGGGLSLLTIQNLISRQYAIPRCVVLVSPWTDLSSSGESYIRNRPTDVLIRPEILSWTIEQVLGDNHEQIKRDDPVYSPMFGSFERFPPMYITVGTAEVLEDDSRHVFYKAKQAGVDVTLEEGLHLAHAYPLFYSFYPEARNTLENIKKWIKEKTIH